MDGFWELKLQPWMRRPESARQEAGGRVTDFSGKTYSVYSKEVIASNGRIKEIVKVLQAGERRRRAIKK
jgi:myo-inositol-1(or 4)-monophosphatase